MCIGSNRLITEKRPDKDEYLRMRKRQIFTHAGENRIKIKSTFLFLYLQVKTGKIKPT